ncbi:MAG TPA: STN domain-containing protein, partial [Prolixibacteraceae bacterium]|nr:STN domain-containing protein [Prolixibacteraceae bacterium]
KVNLTMNDKTLEWILTEIGKQADISFSYNPEAIGSSKRTDIFIDDQSVRFALNTLFDGSMSYRERGKFIIIQPQKPEKKNLAVVEGYLSDENGHSISNATVYNAAAKTVVNTNEYGYFRLEVENAGTADSIKINKQGYNSIALNPVAGKNSFVQISLPESENHSSVNSPKLMVNPQWMVNKEMLAANQNIDESFNRVAQISFLPHISTNSLFSGKTSNYFSINILGGMIENLRFFEVGGIFNIVMKDAGVFQSAGVANYVGGKFIGMQSAGVLNRVGQNFNGGQFAGVFNQTGGNFNGLQSAGTLNHVKGSFWGIQAVGAVNIVGKSIKGLQAAGAINAAKELVGIQAAGFGNATKKIEGAQFAGVMNYAKTGKGLQSVGVINLTDSLSGAQIAGLLNVAGVINGAQIGIINVADSCSGVQLGLININRKGYSHIEVYTTETFLANIAYRGGTKHFYTVLMFGYAPQSVGSNMLYTYGIGGGTSFRNDKKLNYDLDLIAQNVSLGTYTDDINMLYRLGFTANYPIARKVSLNVGLSYNFYLVDSTTPQYESTFSTLAPYFISNEAVGNNRNLKTWFGLKAGIRFL